MNNAPFINIVGSGQWAVCKLPVVNCQLDLYSSFLGRTATIMWQWCYVFDHGYLDAIL